MKSWVILLLCLICTVVAQTPQAFKSSVLIFSKNDPTWTGYLTGTLNYNWNFVTTGAARGAMSLEYTFPGSNGIIDIVRNDIIDNVAVTIRYLKCSTCDADLGAVLPKMFARTGSGTTVDSAWSQTATTLSFQPSTGGALTCTLFNRVGTPSASDLKQLYVELSTNRPCRGVYQSGKEIDFLTYEPVVQTYFTIPASWNCPVPSCPAIVDLVQVLDESGSIGSSNFAKVKEFAGLVVGAYDFADFYVNPIKDGAIMSAVFYSGGGNTGDYCIANIITSGSTTISLTPRNNKALLQSAIANKAYAQGNTCTGGGIQVANRMFRELYTNFPQRTGSSRVMLVVTDGYSNTYCTSNSGRASTILRCETSGNMVWGKSSKCSSYGNDDCSGFVRDRTTNPGTYPVGYCQGSTQCGYSEFMSDWARVNLNMLIFSVGVGSGVNQREIKGMANNNVGQTLTDFVALVAFFRQFVTQTCVDLNIPQCANCKGFCACGGQCLCPSCDDNKYCTIDTCLSNKACDWSPRVCADTNFCTDDTCNEAQDRCDFTDNSARCNDGLFCTLDSCNPNTGCVNVANPCDDGDYCTTDACVEATDTCTSTTISGCRCTGVVCNHTPCKITQCNALSGVCEIIGDVVCNDGNACTDDFCNVNKPIPNSNLLGECDSTRIDCNDNKFCTDDSCDETTGCVNIRVNSTERCPQFDPCISRSCDDTLGCVDTPVNCTEAPLCFEAICVPFVGCVVFQQTCLAPDQDPNCFFSACSATDTVIPIFDENGTFINETVIPGTNGICSAQPIPGTSCGQQTGVNVPLAVGLAAGILAVIIIAIIVCAILGSLSGYGAWKYYNKSRGKIQTLQSNPMYEAKEANVNPLFENK